VTWLLDSEELDDPERSGAALPAGASAAHRVQMLRDLVTQVVHASLTPISRPGIAKATQGLLDAAWVEVTAAEIAEAVEDSLLESTDIDRDGAGRYFSLIKGPAPPRAARSLRIAAAIAADLSDSEIVGYLTQNNPFRHILAAPLLSHAETVRLSHLIKKGDLDAKNRLIAANTRLVLSISRKWRASQSAGHDLDDMFQQGCLGLIRAAEKFEPAMGNRFSTYATVWIRQAIQRGLADQARTIRIPVHVVEKLHKIGRAERKLVTEMGREPTPEEIAEVTDIDPEEVDQIKRSAQAPVSLEKPVGDEEESEFGQLLADELAESPYEAAAEGSMNESLREALENLSYRESLVLQMRYGLGGARPGTLSEVGRTFNVTRERIRQIENQSLEKLQSLAEAQATAGALHRTPSLQRSMSRMWVADLLVPRPWLRRPTYVPTPSDGAHQQPASADRGKGQIHMEKPRSQRSNT